MNKTKYLIQMILFCITSIIIVGNIAYTAGVTTTSSGKYIDEEINVPIIKIGTPEETAQKTIQQSSTGTNLNFQSPSINTDLEKYLRDNLSFPDGYVLSFMFSYDKNGTIANIHLISILEKEFNNNENYTSRIYGDVCKRDGLADNLIYVNDNATIAGVRAELISNTKDGKYLVKIYDLIKNIGKSHTIEIPPYGKDAEFSTIGGMYYGRKVYIAQ